MPDPASHLVDGVGLWRELLRAPPAGPPRPALFVDRDGVVIEDAGFVHRPDQVSLIAGAAAAIACCNRAGVPVVMVSNQSGIGRGLYGWAEFAAVQARMAALLAAAGAALDMVLACAYHADGVGALKVAGHDWRKPRPGMLCAAAEAWPIDLARSWIVGDRSRDLAAGRAAGLAGGVLVATGHGGESSERDAAQLLAGERFEVRGTRSIAAIDAVLARLGAGLEPARRAR